MTAAEATLAAQQGAFPGQVNSTRVINSLLEMAAQYQLRAIPLVTAPWSVEPVGEHSYPVFRLNVTIEGSLSGLLGFIARLEDGEFETLVIEDMAVSRVSDQPEEFASPGTILVEASLDLAIYARALPAD